MNSNLSLMNNKLNNPSESTTLMQWPIQIKLIGTINPKFDNCDLLIAADCTAYAYANIHNEFIKGKVTLIGCPKLDAVDYSEKLTEILTKNTIKSITVLRMEVPCCANMVNVVNKAIENSTKNIPLKVSIVSVDGKLK